MSYCLLILLGHSVQRRVFGVLRASEQDNMKEQFWNLVFYKVVFVFGVVNVQDVEDAVGWCFFVFLIGCLQLARQLCQERHNYVNPQLPPSLACPFLALVQPSCFPVKIHTSYTPVSTNSWQIWSGDLMIWNSRLMSKVLEGVLHMLLPISS